MRLVLLAVLLTATAPASAGRQLHVAVASNFRPTLEALQPLWQAQSATRLVLSGGSSGVLAQQIIAGAPFDIFLAADAGYPERLHRQGVSGQPFIYTYGALILGCQSRFRSGRDALDQIPRLALANRKTAPYGRAAWHWLQQQNPRPQAQVVQSGSVAGALQTVASGNAPCGLLAASFQRLAPALHWYRLERAPLLPQAGAIIHHSADSEQFIGFLLSEPVQALLQEHGYRAIDTAHHD